ncbi:hypothetical protein ACFQ6Q_16390 [Streptomyces sp. NPDC056437]|uniref:hypothetical protein n=1 Tax=Streptomyces sp. NPDC056437 TaxID=3345816 RepID=UPI0036B9EEF5
MSQNEGTESTPSQAEGERPEEVEPGPGTEEQSGEPETTTPSQAEGERDPESDS